MIRLNLLKPEKKEVTAGGELLPLAEEEQGAKLHVPLLIAVLAVTVVGIALMFFFQSNRLSSETKLLSERKLRKTELEGVLKELADMEATKVELDRKIKTIGDLKLRQKDTVVMMDKLSRSLPDWVWLTALSFNGQSLTLRGKAMSYNLLADFMTNLQNSNYFINVQLKSSSSEAQGRQSSSMDVFNFSIVCRFNRAEGTNKGV